MIQRFFLAIVLSLVAQSARAQGGMMPGPGTAHTVSTCSSYTGPGDIVASASAWYGFRGYSCATSAGSSNASDLRRASDSTTVTVKILLGGAFDTASANTFAGVAGTATCHATASTSLICTGASATPLVNQTLTGAGITQPAFLSVACGTFTGGAGTCTMNAAQNFTAETVTFQVALSVAKMYDQTAGNKCASATTCDAVKGAGETEPVFLPNCGAASNNLPCYYSPTFSYTFASTNTFTPNAAHIATHATVAQRVTGTQSVDFISENALNNAIETPASANVWQLVGATSNLLPSTGTTAATGTTHVAVGAGGAGAGGVLNIDGTEFTGSMTNDAVAGGIRLGVGNSGTPVYWMEGGFWDNLVFSGTQRTNMCHNAAVYYGTTQGASC